VKITELGRVEVNAQTYSTGAPFYVASFSRKVTSCPQGEAGAHSDNPVPQALDKQAAIMSNLS
jgi:hypothetical protein